MGLQVPYPQQTCSLKLPNYFALHSGLKFRTRWFRMVQSCLVKSRLAENRTRVSLVRLMYIKKTYVVES